MSQSSSASDAAAGSNQGGDVYGPGPTYNIGAAAGAGAGSGLSLTMIIAIAGLALVGLFIWKRKK